MKNPNDRVIVSIQMPVALKERAEAAAKKRTLGGFSGFARRWIHIGTHVSDSFLPMIEHLAELNGIGESELLERIVRKYIEDIKSLTELKEDK